MFYSSHMGLTFWIICICEIVIYKRLDFDLRNSRLGHLNGNMSIKCVVIFMIVFVLFKSIDYGKWLKTNFFLDLIELSKGKFARSNEHEFVDIWDSTIYWTIELIKWLKISLAFVDNWLTRLRFNPQFLDQYLQCT